MLKDSIEELAATLVELAEIKGDSRLANLLRSAEIELEQTDFDRWNGGTYTYSVHVKVSPRVYASVEPDLKALEGELLERLGNLARPYANEYLGEVTISPARELASRNRHVPLISQPTYWKEGYLRLFISHLAAEKVAAAAVSAQLADYGVSCFVAHEDIEPTKEWQEEILLALSTMDALLALLTPGFNESKWTDQELGVAVGRGVLIIPVRSGVDPYGFIGRYQAMKSEPLEASSLGRRVVDILVKHIDTKDRMTEGLVTAFADSNSFYEAKTRARRLELCASFTERQKDVLKKALAENDQISGAFGVEHIVTRLIGAA
jgi:hypothetical protein